MELGTEQFADPESGTDWQDTEGYGPDRQTPLPPPIDDTVRAPLDYAYTAIDIMAALPRSEAVDADALPADLQHKARAHGDDLDNIVESEQLTTRSPRHRLDRDRPRWPLRRADRQVRRPGRRGHRRSPDSGALVAALRGIFRRDPRRLKPVRLPRYRTRRGSTAGALRAPARCDSAALGVHRR